MRPNSGPAISRPFAGVKGKLASLVASGDPWPRRPPAEFGIYRWKGELSSRQGTADSVVRRSHTRSQAHVDDFWCVIDEQGRGR